MACEEKAPRARKNSRKCILTGTEVTPHTLCLRFVAGPDGALVADLAAKLPGRGAWLAAGPGYLDAALDKGVFNKAFRAATGPPEGMTSRAFADEVLWRLRAAALARLGLAQKCGGLVTGFEKCRAAIKSKPGKPSPAAYLVARDAATDGRAKMEKLLGHGFTLEHIADRPACLSAKQARRPHKPEPPASGQPVPGNTARPAQPEDAPGGKGDRRAGPIQMNPALPMGGIDRLPPIPVIDFFEGEALSRATGAENLIHGILTNTHVAPGFIRDSLRFALFASDRTRSG